MRILRTGLNSLTGEMDADIRFDADDLERLRGLLDYAIPETPTPTRVVGLERLRAIRDGVADVQRRMNADRYRDDDDSDTVESIHARRLPTFGQPGAGQPSHPIHSTPPPPDSLFTGARGLTYWRSLEGRRQSDRNHHLPPQVD